MSNQVNSLKKGLTVKDLVTTGIFSAIFFVFTLVGGLPFAPNPVLTFYMPMGAALLCGPIYLLMVAKVQKRWSVTILGIIMAASKAADELSIASITRGIENPKPRTCLVQIHIGPADLLAGVCFAAYLAVGLYWKGVFG